MSWYFSRQLIWIRVGPWLFDALHQSESPMFSERYGYVRYHRVGTWRWLFGRDPLKAKGSVA